jgi:hypothetical protein
VVDDIQNTYRRRYLGLMLPTKLAMMTDVLTESPAPNIGCLFHRRHFDAWQQLSRCRRVADLLLNRKLVRPSTLTSYFHHHMAYRP